MAKTTPWNKIKKEYLEGVLPKDLATKYATTSNAIRSKACKEKWGVEKETICNNVQQTVEERIKTLTNKALQALESVIDDPECKPADKVSASKALLDVSGLKSVKQEVTGIQGTSVVINREAVLVESNN